MHEAGRKRLRCAREGMTRTLSRPSYHPMRNWDDLQTILALGRAGTMKGAAAVLSVSETTISRRIQKITEGDGAALFDRNGHRWTPTALGSQLIEVAERVEAEIIAAETQVEAQSDRLTGVLKISSLSFINTHFITPQIARFQITHPGLTVMLDASDDVVSLAYRQADIALRLSRPSEGRLVARRLCAIPMTATARRGETPRDWVGLTENLDWTPEMKAGFAHFGRAPVVRIDSFDGLLNAVEATGLGGVAPLCMMLARRQLQALGAPARRDVWLTYHEDLRGSMRARAGVEWLTEVLGGRDCLCGECAA